MNKADFEKEVEKMGLEKVDKSVLNYESNISYYVDEKRTDIYGIYKNPEKQYVIFYKCLERSIMKNLGEYKTEEEAYDVLLADLKNCSK